jgi:hypothetical protein
VILRKDERERGEGRRERERERERIALLCTNWEKE